MGCVSGLLVGVLEKTPHILISVHLSFCRASTLQQASVRITKIVRRLYTSSAVWAISSCSVKVCGEGRA